MIDQTQTRILVERNVDGAAAALFAVLSDPRRHPEIDGSGTLLAPPGAVPITAVGQVFTMDMHHADLGDYRTDNHVVAFEPGRLIVWTTARVGNVPPGFYWSWELAPISPERTKVTHVYDWEDVVDPAVLARVSFPRVASAAMNRTVTRLAEVASG